MKCFSANVCELMQQQSSHYQPTLEEVQEVIKVWNLNAVGTSLSPLVCKINHSCTPNVYVHVDSGYLTAIAVRHISEDEALGSWHHRVGHDESCACSSLNRITIMLCSLLTANLQIGLLRGQPRFLQPCFYTRHTRRRNFR